jgi:hypothetical protein
MSGTTQPQESREASGVGSMATGAAVAVVINQYCQWHNVTVEPDFPIAVATLAAAAAHTLQVGVLAVLDRFSPKKVAP